MSQTTGSTSGTGPDTLVLALSEDAYEGDAQANIYIDGTLLNPTPLTVTASHSAGASELFTFHGTFGAGQHTIGVEFMNDAYGGAGLDRNLWVNSITLNGVAAVPAGVIVVAGGGAGTSSFTVSGGTALPSVTSTPAATPAVAPATSSATNFVLNVAGKNSDAAPATATAAIAADPASVKILLAALAPGLNLAAPATEQEEAPSQLTPETTITGQELIPSSTNGGSSFNDSMTPEQMFAWMLPKIEAAIVPKAAAAGLSAFATILSTAVAASAATTTTTT